MAEIRIDKKVGNVNQAWRMQGSNAMAKFRVSGVNDQGGKILSDAMDTLSNAIGATLKLGKQLQDESDELELVKLENLNREKMTRMNEEFSFTNEDVVNSAVNSHRRALSDWISENKTLSARGKERANVMLEKMNGLYKVSAENQRIKFIANNNLTTARNFLEQAQQAGDFVTAEKWRKQLETWSVQYLGKPTGITPEDVKSKTAAFAYLNCSRGYGIGALRGELESIGKRNADGSLFLHNMLIHQADADYLEKAIRQRINKQINDGADMLDELHVSGGLTAEKLEELHGAGLISAAQYNQQRNFLERKEAAGQKGVALGIYEELFDFDPNGKNQDEIERFQAYMNETLSSADISDEQRLELRAQLKRMFRKSSIDGRKKVENPWTSERGKELRTLIENKYYVKRGEKMDPAASDRKVQILSAGARLLMADNQSKKISEIMEQLNALDTGMKEGEFEKILIGRGRVLDPEKWGKVFDSNDEKDLREKGGFWDWLGDFSGVASRLKKGGWIDKADIVSKRVLNGRVVWELKDGRKVFADEYE